MGLARIYLRGEDRSDPADVARAVGFLEQAGRIYADAAASGPYHASQQALRRARGLLGRLRAAALRPAPGRGAYGSDRGGR